MKKAIGSGLAGLGSKIFSLLRNGSGEVWHRAEIAQMKFSFSQFGEDVVISKYLDKLDVNEGIYIDVGAFNPITFSNTLLLHKQGLQGINIDIDPDKIEEFTKSRPRDFSVVAAISDKVEKLKFACYQARATNQLFPIDATEYVSILGEEPTKVVVVETICLDRILEMSPFAAKEIYYLNIDCEGHDFNVLKSFDLKLHPPRVISIEAWSDKDLEKIKSYLLPEGYVLSAFIHPTSIFTKL